jgi:hypothetical protein
VIIQYPNPARTREQGLVLEVRLKEGFLLKSNMQGVRMQEMKELGQPGQPTADSRLTMGFGFRRSKVTFREVRSPVPQCGISGAPCGGLSPRFLHQFFDALSTDLGNTFAHQVIPLRFHIFPAIPTKSVCLLVNVTITPRNKNFVNSMRKLPADGIV